MPRLRFSSFVRLRSAGSGSFSFYLPVKYVPGLERYDFERESLYSVLKSEYGIEIIDQRMNLQLSRASVKEAQYLGISADDVVFVEKNIARFLYGNTELHVNNIYTVLIRSYKASFPVDL